MSVELIVDQALGPGLDIVRDPDSAEPRAVAARIGGAWLGLDRAHVVDSDAGDGAELPAVVALPVSSFDGCRIAAEIDGALVHGPRTVLVAHVSGHHAPAEPLARVVAGVGDDARWADATGAARIAHEARVRFRVRRQEGRVLGGRAWQPPASADPGARRFTTPHSQSEYRLDRLPPRFLRGMEGLLDDDERVLYAIERPPHALPGRRFAIGGGAERRAALLLLTDRQVIWMVDHLPPDRYAFDWGVDGRLIALEALRRVRMTGDGHHDTIELHVETAGGGSIFILPVELRAEAEVLRDLVARFLPGAGATLPVRRYQPATVDYDPRPAERFGQAQEAVAAVEALRARLAPEALLGALYAPRREAVPVAAAAGLTATRVAVERRGTIAIVGLVGLRDVALTLSPLVGKVELFHGDPGGQHVTSFSYPATFAAEATVFLRQLRHAWADCASTGRRADEPVAEQRPSRSGEELTTRSHAAT